ncbi:MAG: hypothetical protein EOO78_17540, partial [Oxalobacteraceae bacterium]
MLRAPPMILLFLSVLALLLGPVLLRLTRRAAALTEALDAFITVAILALVLFHVIPESLDSLGAAALLALGAGLVAPIFLHGPLHHCVERRSGPLLSLAVLALALHAFLDGLGLLQPAAGHAGYPGLALAVVLHRLLEGMTVWWMLCGVLGSIRTWLVLFALAAATVLGAAAVALAVEHHLAQVAAFAQAAVAGSLLHVVLRHGPSPEPHNKAWRPASLLGGLCGAALLWVPMAGDDNVPAAALHFTGHLFSCVSGPFLLSLALVACCHMLRPLSITARRRWPKPLLLQALLGTALGLCSDACSCGVLPIVHQGDHRQVPRVAALAYLASAPSLGFAGLCASLAVMRPDLLLWRIASLAVASVFAALCAARLSPASAAAAQPVA